MQTNLIIALQDNLEVKCCNIGKCITALNAQGYVVNASKLLRLKLNLILQEQIKYINSFDVNIQNKILNLFNSIS